MNTLPDDLLWEIIHTHLLSLPSPHTLYNFLSVHPRARVLFRYRGSTALSQRLEPLLVPYLEDDKPFQKGTLDLPLGWIKAVAVRSVPPVELKEWFEFAYRLYGATAGGISPSEKVLQVARKLCVHRSRTLLLDMVRDVERREEKGWRSKKPPKEALEAAMLRGGQEAVDLVFRERMFRVSRWSARLRKRQ